MKRLTPEECYLLRFQMLESERLALEAKQADREVRRYLLDIERKYGLLATNSMLNVQTGEIAEKEEKAHEIAKTGGEDGVLHQLHDWNQNGRDI